MFFTSFDRVIFQQNFFLELVSLQYSKKPVLVFIYVHRNFKGFTSDFFCNSDFRSYFDKIDTSFHSVGQRTELYEQMTVELAPVRLFDTTQVRVPWADTPAHFKLVKNEHKEVGTQRNINFVFSHDWPTDGALIRPDYNYGRVLFSQFRCDT